MTVKARATIKDLYRVPENGTAEIVKGELVTMSPTGVRPGSAGIRISASLLQHEEEHGGGFAQSGRLWRHPESLF